MIATLIIVFCSLFFSIEAKIDTKRQVHQLPAGIVTTTPNKTDGYWTPERMLNSTPIEEQVDYDDLDNLNSTPFKRQMNWTADRTRSIRQMSEKHHANITQYPFYNYGKLFVKTATATGHCTAAFVRRNVLITAAHCVRDAAGWYKNFTFFQRFGGAANKGRQIRVDKPFAYSNYISADGKKDYRWDFAFLTTIDSADGTPLSTGFTSQPAADELLYFVGYSVKKNGAEREAEKGLMWATGYRNPQINALIHAPTNPLLTGSAGGAWLTQDESGVYRVVGVASHGKPERRFTGVFSPLLNRRAMELLSVAENQVPTTPCRRCNNDR